MFRMVDNLFCNNKKMFHKLTIETNMTKITMSWEVRG